MASNPVEMFYMHLCDTLKKLGFKDRLLDPALWYRLRDDKKAYEYFSHQVDDFLVSGNQPEEWIKKYKNHTPSLAKLNQKYI